MECTPTKNTTQDLMIHLTKAALSCLSPNITYWKKKKLCHNQQYLSIMKIHGMPWKHGSHLSSSLHIVHTPNLYNDLNHPSNGLSLNWLPTNALYFI